MLSQKKELNLLLIEDNLGDAILLREYLEDIRLIIHTTLVDTFEKAKEKLEQYNSYDAIFLDLSLPDKDGESLVIEIVQLARLTPVIVLTGYGNLEFSIKTLSIGASDYLVKDELNAAQLSKSILYSIERKRIEQKLSISNERYEILVKATSDTIWDWNIVDKTIISNQGISRVFGYDESDRLQSEKWWRSKIHPQDFKKVIHALNNNFKQGISILQLEYRFCCSDGSYKYVLDRAFVVMDNNRKPIRMIGAMQDVTGRKEEELRLRLLESVITQTTEAVLITDAKPLEHGEQTIVYANDAFTAQTGYTLEEILGKSPLILHGELTNIDEVNKLRTALNNYECCSIEIVNYKKSGEPFWINIAIAPVADNKGKYTHWISIQRDITITKQYLQSIEEQNKKLKEIAWMQSHVVRAPVARIMGLINMITDKIPTDQLTTDQLIQSISDSANELDLIIREIVRKTEKVSIEMP